jgi:hypothetical protein
MPSPLPQTEHGIPGGSLSGGRLRGFEFNPNLRGRAWVEICDKMLTDPVILAARNAHRDSLLSANYYLEPGIKGDAEAEAICDEVARNLGLNGYAGELAEPWEKQVGRLLNYLDVGYRYFEETWAYENGRAVFKGWADRHPRAHKAWLSPDDGRTFGGVEQNSVGGAKPKAMTADRLLLLVNDQQANNCEGRGTLRACHYDYALMTHAWNMLGIALERWAMSTPLLTYDRAEIAASLDKPSPGAIDAVIADAQEAMKAYLARENTTLTAAKGIVFGTYGDGQLNPSSIGDIEQMVTRRIFYAYLVQFLSLGVSGVGARNVGDVHQAFFYASLTNTLDHVCGEISGPGRPGAGTIGRLVAFNRGVVPAGKLPRLQHQGLSPEPLMQALNIVPLLRQHNLLTDTDELEQLLLTRLKAGPLTPVARALRKARHDFQMGNPGANAPPTTQASPKGPAAPKDEEDDADAA